MINDSHPSVFEFKKNEVATLEYLNAWRLLKGFPELDQTVQYALSNYKPVAKLEKIAFEFHARVPLIVEKHTHQMFLEARISEKEKHYDEATYLLAIAGKDDPDELVRKFHFDHAHPSIATNNPVPIFHLQYGGKLSPKMQQLQIKDAKIDSWLSVPRLNFPPVNLAILLDMAFSEFRSEETKKLTEKAEWRKLVFNNEQFILRGYYCGIANFCSSASYNPKRLIRDFIYGQ